MLELIGLGALLVWLVRGLVRLHQAAAEWHLQRALQLLVWLRARGGRG